MDYVYDLFLDRVAERPLAREAAGQRDRPRPRVDRRAGAGERAGRRARRISSPPSTPRRRPPAFRSMSGSSWCSTRSRSDLLERLAKLLGTRIVGAAPPWWQQLRARHRRLAVPGRQHADADAGGDLDPMIRGEAMTLRRALAQGIILFGSWLLVQVPVKPEHLDDPGNNDAADRHVQGREGVRLVRRLRGVPRRGPAGQRLRRLRRDDGPVVATALRRRRRGHAEGRHCRRDTGAVT